MADRARHRVVAEMNLDAATHWRCRIDADLSRMRDQLPVAGFPRDLATLDTVSFLGLEPDRDAARTGDLPVGDRASRRTSLTSGIKRQKTL
jgi:hypothetical protein